MILLANRAVIRVSGEDRFDFLQGLITNDINLLKTQQAIYAALLTPQGKYLFDFIISVDGDGFLLDCEAARKDDLLRRLKMYTLRAKVVVEDLEDMKVYSDSEQGFKDPRHSDLGCRLLTEEEQEKGVFAKYEKLRVSLGVPDSFDFTPDKSFIQQFRADELNAINYKKGCYVGQEVIARTHYKGNIRKSLFIAKGDLPSVASDIEVEGKKIGVMLSGTEDMALALCDIEAAKKANGLSFTITSIS